MLAGNASLIAGQPHRAGATGVAQILPNPFSLWSLVVNCLWGSHRNAFIRRPRINVKTFHVARKKKLALFVEVGIQSAPVKSKPIKDGITTVQAAKILGLDPSAIRKRALAGTLPFEKRGRDTYVSRRRIMKELRAAAKNGSKPNRGRPKTKK